jgi:hypothetical protein
MLGGGVDLWIGLLADGLDGWWVLGLMGFGLGSGIS